MPTAARRATRKTSSGIPLPRFDARRRASRRYAELVLAFESEVSGELTDADRVMISQAASMSLRAEQIRESIVAGNVVDDDDAIRLASEIRRILIALKAKGSKNKPAPITMRQRLMGGNVA
jgi:hypothetical protein